MIVRSSGLALGAALLFSSQFVNCLSPSDVPADTPISSLVASAKANLAEGRPGDALTYFDVAVSRDPKNYLTIFQRGATYLSLGKNALASEDFNKVLLIKPDFEGALLQRAKIKSRSADWEGAKSDYRTAKREDSPDFKDLLEAEGAAILAVNAEKAQDWESCVSHSGTAIMVASTTVSLRQLRARCRFERGEVQEGVSDLQHVLQISPGSTEPHLRISSMLFYSLGDIEKGLAQVRKCLHSDPDSKSCSKLHKQEKRVDRQLKKVNQLREKRQYNNAVKLLVGGEEDTGLIEDINNDIKEAKALGMIHENSPNDLYGRLIEMTCELYSEMNNKKKATPYCEENLQLNPDALHALLFKARRQIDSEEYEPAIQTLNHAKEHHQGASQIGQLLQKAHMLLKRSKNKDYYKVLQVSNDADARTIKKAYRTLIKKYHPDKAVASGMSKDESEKKMATINEAYEVLSDPEKKAMFDRGDDPNSHENQNQGNPFQGSPFGGGQQFFFQSGGGGGGQRFQFQQGGFQFGGM